MKLTYLKYTLFILITTCTSNFSIAQTFNTCEEFYTNCSDEWNSFLASYREEILCRQWIGNCSSDENISRSGRISIGTDVFHPSYRMTVKGGIIADQMKIAYCNNGDWCDYVFEDDYNLFSLQEVAEHIQKYGHLHKTPSAAEIEKEGSFALKEVTLDQQEKIEEAFLHLIKLKKETDFLEQKLAKLKKENQALRKKK